MKKVVRSTCSRPQLAPKQSNQPQAETDCACGLVRVAALIDTATVSGPGRQLAALAGEMPHFGFDMRVYMLQRRGRPASPYISYLKEAGVQVIVLHDNGPHDLGLVWRLYCALREVRPHIVQTHNYRMTVVAFLIRVLMRPKWKWIAFFHGATFESFRVKLYNQLDRLLLPTADQLVVMSKRQQEAFSPRRPDVHLIYNAVLTLPNVDQPVDLSRLRRSHTPLIGAVSRLSPEKGLDVLIAALKLLPTDVTLVIAGDGPEKEALISQVASSGLESSVHFVGPIANVIDFYKQLDLVVLPSRSEGLPNVLLEALGCDVAVVATDVGAVREVLDTPLSGEIALADDAQSLAGAIERALKSGHTEAASAARMMVARRFSLRNRIDAHVNLYRSVLGAPPTL